jgi:hypothetical protein
MRLSRQARTSPATSVALGDSSLGRDRVDRLLGIN